MHQVIPYENFVNLVVLFSVMFLIPSTLLIQLNDIWRETQLIKLFAEITSKNLRRVSPKEFKMCLVPREATLNIDVCLFCVCLCVHMSFIFCFYLDKEAFK